MTTQSPTPPGVSRGRLSVRLAAVLAVAALAAAIPLAQGAGGAASGASAAPAPLERPIRVAAVGDTVMGSLPYGLPPDRGRGLFTAVRPLLVGDVVMGNFEGTLTKRGSSKCGPRPGPNCYAFHTPPSFAPRLRDAGFTVMSVANNHADDFGAPGRADTRRNLARVGVRATGWPGSIAYLKVAGGEVAVLGFAFNTFSNSSLNIPRAKALVARAAARAPVVIVNVHAGAEGAGATHVRPGTETFLGENRGDSLRFAHAAVDAGADLVVMHGPHVLRGMEFYRSRLVAYSMGNFMGYAVFSLTGGKNQSGVLDVRLAPDGAFRSGVLHPVQLVGKGVPTPGGSAISRVRALSAQDFGARGAVIGVDGAIGRP